MLEEIAVSALTSSFVVLLFRDWISTRLKESISHEYQVKFEAVKHDLEYRSKVNFLKESRLHEERAQIIKEIYSEMVDAVDTSSALVYHFNLQETHPDFFEHLRIPTDGNPIKWKQYNQSIIAGADEDKLARVARDRTSRNLNKTRKNRIYFEPVVAQQIEAFFKCELYVFMKFADVTFRDRHTFEPMIAKEVIESWKSANENAMTLYPILEGKFRDYLGFELKEK